MAGFCVNCPEAADTIVEDRREIGTTYAFAPPRIYENLLTLTMVRMEDAGALKRGMFHFFMEHARKWGEKILNRESVPLHARLIYRLGDLLVYGPLKNRFGLSRIRVGYTAGEAIGPEIFRFYRSLGLNLKQLYGQTEASVYITAQPDGEIYADTVGKPNIDVEVKIAENGEVLFRSPGVFPGYYKDPERTAETKTPDGWVRTGDAGFFDPQDRASEDHRPRQGCRPAQRRHAVRAEIHREQAQVLSEHPGSRRVRRQARFRLRHAQHRSHRGRSSGPSATTSSTRSYQELAGHPRVYDMLQKHVDEVNRSLAEEKAMAGAQIRRFLILHKELDADDGELTRTQKVRRGLIARPLRAAGQRALRRLDTKPTSRPR